MKFLIPIDVVEADEIRLSANMRNTSRLSPQHGITGMSLIENSNSVPGATIRTRSAARIRAASGSCAAFIAA